MRGRGREREREKVCVRVGAPAVLRDEQFTAECASALCMCERVRACKRIAPGHGAAHRDEQFSA